MTGTRSAPRALLPRPLSPHAPRRLVLAFLALGPAACGAGAGDGSVTAAVDTVDGVERLSYAAEPGPRLDWSTDTVAVLGDAFAEDAYQFNNVRSDGLGGDDAGHLYVLDSQGKRVLEYGPDGGHRATHGRAGEGPGELSQPMGLEVGPGDTVWVSDFSNRRITGLPSGGGDPVSIPFEEGAGIPSPRMAVLEDGFILRFSPLFNFRRDGSGQMRMSRGGQDEEAGPARPLLPVVRMTRGLDPVDTLWTSPEPPMDMVQLEAAGRFMVAMMSREFYPGLQWDAFSDGGIVVSDSAGYVLRLVDAGGTVRRIIRRDPPPREATEADREAARQRVRDEATGGGGVRIGGGGPDEETQRRLLEQRLEKMTFAELIPRVVALRVDRSDRIWVGVSEETPDEVARIDLYDRTGELIGELRDFPMPDVFLAGDRIGVLREDELDVQQVVVMRVDGAGALAEL